MLQKSRSEMQGFLRVESEAPRLISVTIFCLSKSKPEFRFKEREVKMQKGE